MCFLPQLFKKPVDKTQCVQMLTHSLITKFRNLQDLGSSTILCYLPWSP